MVELWFMTLDFGEVPVVEVPRVLELIVLENNDPASLVPHCQVLTRLVEGDRGQDVVFGDVLLVPLSQAVNVHPVQAVCHTVGVYLGLPGRLLGQVLGWKLISLSTFVFHFDSSNYYSEI